jgi:hypothetical protein
MLGPKQKLLSTHNISVQELVEPDERHSKFFMSMSGRFFQNHLTNLASDREELLSNGLDHVIYHEPGKVLFTRVASLHKELFNPDQFQDFIRSYLASATMKKYKSPMELRHVLDAYYFLYIEPDRNNRSAIVLENLLNFNYSRLKRSRDGERFTSLDFALAIDGFTEISEECYPQEDPVYRILNFYSLDNSPIH